jgi:hypothetical protein
VETRVEERNWKKIEKNKLPKEYKWEGKWAKGEKKRGRAAGGEGEVGDGKKNENKR